MRATLPEHLILLDLMKTTNYEASHRAIFSNLPLKLRTFSLAPCTEISSIYVFP